MRSEKALNRALRTALRSAKVSQQSLADKLGHKAHSAISRKLTGKTPWTYAEVHQVSELLGIEDIAGANEIVVRPRNKIIELVDELLNSLSDDALHEVVYVFHLLIKDRIGGPPGGSRKRQTALNALSIIAEKRGR